MKLKTIRIFLKNLFLLSFATKTTSFSEKKLRGISIFRRFAIEQNLFRKKAFLFFGAIEIDIIGLGEEHSRSLKRIFTKFSN